MIWERSFSLLLSVWSLSINLFGFSWPILLSSVALFSAQLRIYCGYMRYKEELGLFMIEKSLKMM
jgi:hypothetical protein